ncbi:hypothetical protein GCM10009116_08720 [Brevundimonas basaltis]
MLGQVVGQDLTDAGVVIDDKDTGGGFGLHGAILTAAGRAVISALKHLIRGLQHARKVDVV